MNPADIVERLRDAFNPEYWTSEIRMEAADEIERVRTALQYTVHEYEHAKAEIERLRKVNTKLQRDLSDRISDIFEHDAEIERLRAALEPFAAFAEYVAKNHPGWDHDEFTVGRGLTLEPFRAAHAALKEKQHEPG